MASLPNELIDHIFGFLGKDRITLRVCAEASPVLRPIAEPHMYKHVRLYSNLTTRPFRFVHLLTTKPHLAAHVQSVALINGRVPKDHSSTSEPAEEWSGIPDLPSLKEITLISTGHIRHPDDAKHGMEGTWRRLLQMPPVETITIQGRPQADGEVWLSDLDQCPNLKHLRIFHMTDFMETRPSTPRPSFLERFEFEGGIGHLDMITPWLIAPVPQLGASRIANLRSLIIHSLAHEYDAVALLQIFQACRHSLEELSMDISAFRKRYAPDEVETPQPSSTPTMSDLGVGRFLPLLVLGSLTKLTLFAYMHRTYQLRRPGNAEPRIRIRGYTTAFADVGDALRGRKEFERRLQNPSVLCVLNDIEIVFRVGTFGGSALQAGVDFANVGFEHLDPSNWAVYSHSAASSSPPQFSNPIKLTVKANSNSVISLPQLLEGLDRDPVLRRMQEERKIVVRAHSDDIDPDEEQMSRYREHWEICTSNLGGSSPAL